MIRLSLSRVSFTLYFVKSTGYLCFVFCKKKMGFIFFVFFDALYFFICFVLVYFHLLCTLDWSNMQIKINPVL